MGTTQHKAAYEHPQHLVATSSSMGTSCPRQSPAYSWGRATTDCSYPHATTKTQGQNPMRPRRRTDVLTIGELTSINPHKRPGPASMAP